jgi:hypothetical protein
MATSPLRILLFAVFMPISVVILLIGLGSFAFESVKSGAFTVSTVPGTAYGMIALGVIATVAVARVRRGAGKLATVLEQRAGDIAVVKLVRIRKYGAESGQLVLLDAGGRPLAQALVNRTRDFDDLAAHLAQRAPSARIERYRLERGVEIRDDITAGA